MADEPTARRNPYADIAPALGDYTDRVLFGEVWERPELSKRDRSLITVATLVALYRTNELPFHLKRALENGVTKDELIELITHLAFYAGWPTANTAVGIARQVFAEAGQRTGQEVDGGNQKMEVKKNGTQPSQKGPEEYFTGSVRIDPLSQAHEPSRVSCALVTFEPGARTAWHIHPLGQTLIVTQGCGWVQSEGGPKVEIRPGDVVSCPPNEKHWHGATPTTAMTHIAIQEALDGKVVEWMEKVSDEQYQAGLEEVR